MLSIGVGIFSLFVIACGDEDPITTTGGGNTDDPNPSENYIITNIQGWEWKFNQEGRSNRKMFIKEHYNLTNQQKTFDIIVSAGTMLPTNTSQYTTEEVNEKITQNQKSTTLHLFFLKHQSSYGTNENTYLNVLFDDLQGKTVDYTMFGDHKRETLTYEDLDENKENWVFTANWTNYEDYPQLLAVMLVTNYNGNFTNGNFTNNEDTTPAHWFYEVHQPYYRFTKVDPRNKKYELYKIRWRTVTVGFKDVQGADLNINGNAIRVVLPPPVLSANGNQRYYYMDGEEGDSDTQVAVSASNSNVTFNIPFKIEEFGASLTTLVAIAPTGTQVGLWNYVASQNGDSAVIGDSDDSKALYRQYHDDITVQFIDGSTAISNEYRNYATIGWWGSRLAETQGVFTDNGDRFLSTDRIYRFFPGERLYEDLSNNAEVFFTRGVRFPVYLAPNDTNAIAQGFSNAVGHPTNQAPAVVTTTALLPKFDMGGNKWVQGYPITIYSSGNIFGDKVQYFYKLTNSGTGDTGYVSERY